MALCAGQESKQAVLLTLAVVMGDKGAVTVCTFPARERTAEDKLTSLEE